LKSITWCYQDAWATAHPGDPGFAFTPAWFSISPSTAYGPAITSVWLPT
jgi:hypothetical protein